jgi:hypothetical protein
MGPRLGHRSVSRRRIAAVVLVFVVAWLARPASGQEHGDGLLPPGDWTEEQEHHLLDLIDATEAELPRFSDPATVEALGFHDIGVTAPGGYDHYINNAWIDDEHILDPAYPETVVFQVTWDQETGQPSYQVVAAMFLLPNDYEMSDIPEDLAWMPGWHIHPEVCVTDDYIFTGLNGGDGNCSSGHAWLKPPMLHVWIVDNECDHRFGEIGVGGVGCDLDHGHDPDPHEPDPHDPDPHDPDPHDPGPDPHDPHGGDDPDHDMGNGGGTTSPGTAHPARPVTGQPHYAG